LNTDFIKLVQLLEERHSLLQEILDYRWSLSALTTFVDYSDDAGTLAYIFVSMAEQERIGLSALERIGLSPNWCMQEHFFNDSRVFDSSMRLRYFQFPVGCDVHALFERLNFQMSQCKKSQCKVVKQYGCLTLSKLYSALPCAIWSTVETHSDSNCTGSATPEANWFSVCKQFLPQK